MMRMRASTSWRITRPIHLVSRAARALLHRKRLDHVALEAPDGARPVETFGTSAKYGAFPLYFLGRARGALKLRNLRLLWRWRRLRAAIRGESQRYDLIRSGSRRSATAQRTVYETYVENNRIAPHVRSLLEDAAARFHWHPTFSVVVAVVGSDTAHLEESIRSVQTQIYGRWQLCVACGTEEEDQIQGILAGWDGDQQITTACCEESNGVYETPGRAAGLATGDYLVFLEPGDLLAPHALFEIAALLQSEGAIDVAYSDEDRLTPEGKRFGGFFKPTWSPTLLLGHDYMGHLTCIKRALYEKVGGFRSTYASSMLYDLRLRTTCESESILHIPKILYHSRVDSNLVGGTSPVSLATGDDARAALEDHCRQVQIDAEIYEPVVAGRASVPLFQLDWSDRGPSVSIIIPTYNQNDLLEHCIDSIHNHTTYQDYEILVVDNGSDSQETLRYLEKLGHAGIRVIRLPNDDEGFSFSSLNNQAVQQCNTDYVLFLNNDTEVVEPRWLSRMMGYAQLADVGAVGARLVYPDGAIQHAGVLLDQKNGLAPGHAFHGHPKDLVSYQYLAEVTHECIAVTAACMLTPSETFRRLGGFREDLFRVSLQDVDYCLRLRELGLRCLYVADTELKHHETLTRSHEDDPIELARFKDTYRHFEDPYYNRNLSLDTSYAYIPDCTLDYASYRDEPLKVVGFVHNLNHEGAPVILTDLAAGLVARGRLEMSVVTYQDGPLGDRLREAGIDYRVINLPGMQDTASGWSSDQDCAGSVDVVIDLLRQEKPDVVVAVVLNSFFVVRAAARLSIPSIWCILENYDAELMARNLRSSTIRACEEAFAEPYKVVFGSRETKAMYERYNQKGNYAFIHHSLDNQTINGALRGLTRQEARSSLGLEDGEKMILTVGTICHRKHQETIVRALKSVAKHRDDFCAYLVGAREEEPYLHALRSLVRRYRLGERVRIVPETDDVWRYYLAADLFAFSSLNECYSLAILEAMAFGLPIVTTPCGGIGEQVRIDVNAVTYRFEDHFDMAEKLERLIADDELRQRMGRNSRNMHTYMQSFDEMLTKYERLLLGAWQVGAGSG